MLNAFITLLIEDSQSPSPQSSFRSGMEPRYHHVGFPTDEPRPDETYLERFKVYVSGYETSPFGVEWMRFEPGSPFPEIVKTVPHVAFEVDDLEAAIAGHEVLIEPNSPSAGVRVAFILHDGAPIEFLQFD
jgi:catechol 2,3-dioxygenase-like lactoylglutathione lyase family enzyme